MSAFQQGFIVGVVTICLPSLLVLFVLVRNSFRVDAAAKDYRQTHQR